MLFINSVYFVVEKTMKTTTLILLCLITVATSMKAQTLTTGNKLLDDAFLLAVRTMDNNTHDSLLKAGGNYGGEWTRDISINGWNAASLLRPKIVEYSLWKVTVNNRSVVGHEYWDKIIWVIGAWNHYLVTGDIVFLKQAYLTSKATMTEMENYAFEINYGLFMGPAVFQDGIAGYEEPVYDPEIKMTHVLKHRNACAIKCLSTNAVYYKAYILLAKMAKKFEPEAVAVFSQKAMLLKDNIRRYFFNEKTGELYYLIDHRGYPHNFTEGLGISYATIFDLLTAEEAKKIIANAYQSKYGLPCVYPHFKRFNDRCPGRHNVMVWPFINAFYGEACVKTGNYEKFWFEVNNVANLAINKGQNDFIEVYDPVTGEPSGGWQIGKTHPIRHNQTWNATGYIRMFLNSVFGINLEENGIYFTPLGIPGMKKIRLENIPYRDAILNITVYGYGNRVKKVLINGKKQNEAFLPTIVKGKINIDIML